MRIIAELDERAKEDIVQGIYPYNGVFCLLAFEDKYEAEKIKKLLERLLEKEGE